MSGSELVSAWLEIMSSNAEALFAMFALLVGLRFVSVIIESVSGAWR